MSQEAAKLPSEAEWRPLDQQSFLQALDVFRRTTELERLDQDPDLEHLALIDWREEMSKGVLFCAYCLAAIVILLLVIVVRM